MDFSQDYLTLFTGRHESCVDAKLKIFADKVKSRNAFLYKSNHDEPESDAPNKYFLPYIGTLA